MPVEAADSLTLAKDMKFEVQGNRSYSFSFTIGAKLVGESDPPWLYHFAIVLDDDNGDKLDLGQFTTLSYGERDPSVNVESREEYDLAGTDADLLQCVEGMYGVLDSGVNSTGYVDPFLVEQRDRLREALNSKPSS